MEIKRKREEKDTNSSVLYRALEDTVIQSEFEEMHKIKKISHRFSEEYNRKISQLIGTSRQNRQIFTRKNLRRIALVAIVAVIFCSVSAGASSKLEKVVVGLKIVENREYAEFSFIREGQQPEMTEEDFENFQPTYIPEGFEKDWESADFLSFDVTYLNYDDVNKPRMISYGQSVLTNEGTVNIENMEHEIVQINGNDAYIAYNDEHTNLVWTDGKYSYLLVADCDKEETIKIANSLKVKE